MELTMECAALPAAETRPAMHVITALRLYLGLSQEKLAKAVALDLPDLSDMETLPPYGRADKYRRLADYFSMPMDALVKNDFTLIPESFFADHAHPNYAPRPTAREQLLGRQGEEFIFRRERERLESCYPALAKLVLPFYKMSAPSPGYDILSFSDSGIPFALEVKTSLDSSAFRLTTNEFATANHMEQSGMLYRIACVSHWGSSEQTVHDMTFSELRQLCHLHPMYYRCTPKGEKKQLTGLAYFRQMAHMRQADLAAATHVRQEEISLYESGQRCPSVDFYLRASQVLGVTIDELLQEYEAAPVRIRKRRAYEEELGAWSNGK